MSTGIVSHRADQFPTTDPTRLQVLGRFRLTVTNLGVFHDFTEYVQVAGHR